MTQPTARPLSPHLQVYKPQITSVLSILHRMTGILLAAFAVGWVAWLIALNRGEDTLAAMQSLLSSIPGVVLAVLATWTLFYHLLNGVRHLVWDSGRGLELGTARLSGWMVVIFSLLLTALAWGVWL